MTSSSPRILVTYDGSETSRQAFPVALDLAGRLGASVFLLRVHLAPKEVWAHPEEAYREARLRELQQGWQADLETLAAELAAEGVPVEARASLLGRRWSVSDEVLAVAEEIDAYLIAMATHGENTLRRFLMGSTAQSVVSRSPRPVLVINATATRKP